MPEQIPPVLDENNKELTADQLRTILNERKEKLGKFKQENETLATELAKFRQTEAERAAKEKADKDAAEQARLSATLAKECKGKEKTDALLHVPSDASARFETDRKLAEIAKETEDGVCCFACLRQTYITLTNDVGGSVKAVQTLARHSTPTLTFGTYAKARSAELHGVVEKLGALVCA